MQATDIMVDAWFDYWIDIKKKTVRPNTVRNYTERYYRNIKKIIGKMLLSEVKPLHCQKIFSDWQRMPLMLYKNGALNGALSSKGMSEKP